MRCVVCGVGGWVSWFGVRLGALRWLQVLGKERLRNGSAHLRCRNSCGNKLKERKGSETGVFIFYP